VIFVWDDWNAEHIARHGVTRMEAEYIVRHASAPFPRQIEGNKHMVRGQTSDGRYLQVIFAYPDHAGIDIGRLDLADRLALQEGEEAVFVVHARDLSPREKRQVGRVRRM
jgi:uncharacterized DUF497 family protein